MKPSPPLVPFTPGVSRRVSGPFNHVGTRIQRVRIGEGCPNGCPFCYEPQDHVFHGIPEFHRQIVQILDMNLLSYPNATEILQDLTARRVNGRVVKYEMVCGFDYRRLTPDMATAIHDARFQPPIRLAWDGKLTKQGELYKAIQILRGVRYRGEEIMVFMICNWQIPYNECCRKLDLLKVWGVKVADCYWNGQVAPRITPQFWTAKQITMFRAACRKHNQLIRFKFDPEAHK